MRSYDEMMGLIEKSIADYNAAAEEGEETVDYKLVRKSIRDHGGRTALGVSEMNADSLAKCGVPLFIARALATVFSAETSTKPSTTHKPTLPDDLIDVDVDLLVDALEEGKDGAAPSKPSKICRELSSRTKNQAFLLLNQDKTLNRKATVERVEGLVKGLRMVARPMVDGRPVKPLQPGESPRRETTVENPLYTGRALLSPGLVCEYTNEEWEGIQNEGDLRTTAQFLSMAVKSRILVIRDPEIARGIFNEAHKPNALATFQRRYPVANDLWERTPVNKRPDLEIVDEEASGSTPPFVEAGGSSLPAPPIASKKLGHSVCLELHAAAIQAGLAFSRESLLAGYDTRIKARLPDVGNPGEQILRDLVELDDHPGLAIWLSNAKRLSEGRSPWRVFEKSSLELQEQRGSRWPVSISGPESKLFVDALLSAFPRRESLAQFCTFVLGENLETITAPGTLHNVCCDLVMRFNSNGGLPKLFTAVYKENPNNPTLRALAARYS